MVYLHLQKEFCYYKVILILLVETSFGLTGVSDARLSFVEMQGCPLLIRVKSKFKSNQIELVGLV